jgi:hypothetical protein
MVETLDRGFDRCSGSGEADLRADAKHAPVRFEAGSMGNTEAFDVSPQHRMFVGGWQAELNFGQPEVLVSAVHMVGMPGVTRRPRRVSRTSMSFWNGTRSSRPPEPGRKATFPGVSLERHEDEIRRQMPKKFAALAANMRTTPLARPHVKGRDARVLVA